MGLIRPATPGFIVTLVATGLLAVVSFCVPYFKSVFFLKARLTISGTAANITFGTLGYCLELTNGTVCSSPSVGYQLDINGLVGNKLPIQIPQVAVKWVTYALVLHIIALALSAGSAVFGLLAHVREMSMTCCSTCVSGFAAAVAMLAFVFDLALFFLAKARINAVGTAEIGNAIWLTLAAWVLLFFSGCFYTLGRCCISKRSPRGDWDKRKDHESGSTPPYRAPQLDYGEQMRLDAIKADADRKAHQKATEGGLPAFSETQPLTARVDGDAVYLDSPYQDHAFPPNNGAYGRHANVGGYVQAPSGTRAVDDYYSPVQTHAASQYPPAPQPPRRQQSSYAASTYAPSTYSHTAPKPLSPPPTNTYLAAQTYGADRYGSPAQDYGHTAGGSSYHTATSHNQQPTNYSQYDPYDAQQPHHQQSYHADPYGGTAANPYTSNAGDYYGASQTQPQHDRAHTFGGDGYGGNTLPPLPEHDSSYLPYPGDAHAAVAPINTQVGYAASPQTSPMRPQPQPSGSDDAPPVYDAGTSNTTGHWGKH